MNVDATMRTILVASLLVIVIPVTFFCWEMPSANLTATEKELINFSSQPLVISPPRPQATFSGLDCPVRVASKKQPAAGTGVKSLPFGPIPAANSATVPSKPGRRISFDSRPTVSMVYSEGSIKTAIIDGHVLHEGSFFGKYLLVKIEKTRVLMRTAGKDIWLSID